MEKSIERNSAHVVKTKLIHWETIEWNLVEQDVRRIQERIFRATRDKEWRKVKALQSLLVGSLDVRLVAVKRVTQENSGRYTAGIDGKIYPDARTREALVEELQGIGVRHYKCQPVRRVYIPKPGKDERRPLGIPTLKDRVMQEIVKMALEPEWEAKFEPNSYGFRPGRRCMDAIVQIKNTIMKVRNRNSSPWILDADITKCFDTIDHDALLRKIPVFKDVIRGWLKAGVIEFGRYFKTRTGTPQGGIISPLLANIALDGMERIFGIYNGSGVYINPAKRHGKNNGVSLVRYADDFVVLAPTKERIVEYVVPRLREFLAEMGLVLNDAKTRIIHRDDGFDFLGFNIRQFHGSGTDICLVRPSKKAIERHVGQVKDIMVGNQQQKQHDLIEVLNPVLRGWATYYKYCNAKSTLSGVDSRVWGMLWHWCKRRHCNKGGKWIREKYFRRIGASNWVFADTMNHQLFREASLKVRFRNYTKVVSHYSPFDVMLHEYWMKRRAKPGSLAELISSLDGQP